MGNESSPAPKQRHVLLVGAAIVLLAFALRLVAAAYSVPSSSMEPTLLPGDHLVVVRYLAGSPERGHVVVFDDGTGTSLVKRVIGLPGDSVQIDHDHVLVNGELLVEDSYTTASHAPGGSVHVVPEDHYFLLGDNRDHSADSREFGFVPREAMVGRARLIYWSAASPGGIRWSRVFHLIE